MSNTVLILIVVGVTGLLALGVLLWGMLADRSSTRSQLRNIVASQRDAQNPFPGQQDQSTIFDAAQESRVERRASAQLTLRKKLKYARWNMPPMLFRVSEVFLSLAAFTIVSLNFNVVMQGISLMTGPIFMRWLLNLFMDRRFKAFDADYPQMILSMVGLLKTGMNVMGALEAAGEGLEEGSLVKEEIRLLSERLRFGVPEDKSIGSFGEDIYHPEIELFVQALLLSRRVGGNLSDTLDRLAKQVRKRQYFRNSASAAVGMQRGSIWFIIAILVGMEGYLWYVYPESITKAVNDPMGWQVWQFGIVVILLGIFWVRQVTKIRI